MTSIKDKLETKVRELVNPTFEPSSPADTMDLSKSIDYSVLRGKTALITGAAGGLGRGMALEWAKNG
jgi:5,10-methylene-tetrahydrofolate dehydrogenase/methenyl tetrahydrofolate cyclohydrolase